MKKFFDLTRMLFKRKSHIALCILLAVVVTAFTSCETFARAFADQAGRNTADALMKKAAPALERPEAAEALIR